MICSKCNAQVPEGAGFCPQCGQKMGAPIPEETVASVEEAVMETPAETAEAAKPMDKAKELFAKAKEAAAKIPVKEMGAKVKEAASKVPVKEMGDKAKGLFAKVPAKVLKIGAAAVALLLVISIVLSLFSGAKTYNYALYVRDREIQYAEMPKGKDVTQITEDFAQGIGDYQLSTAASLAGYIQLTADGKTVFYPDKVDDEGYTLYCRSLTNSKRDPIKIDTDLEDGYYINEKGTLVTYLKDGKLYQHDLKEKTKIASDVEGFVVSSDGKTIIYAVEDDDGSYEIYSKKGNKDTSKMATAVTEIVHVSEDASFVVYLKDENLYTQKVGKDATKVSSDVEVAYAYDSGEIYYAKLAEITYWDLMDDDYDDPDSDEYEDYKDWLQENELEVGDLYYYNGKESVKLTMVAGDMDSWRDDKAVMYLEAMEELPSISLTDCIEDDLGLWEIREKATESVETCVAVGKDVIATGLEEVYDLELSEDGKSLYVMADYDSDENTVSLYHITLNGGKVKKSEKLDKDVYAYYLYVVSDGKTNHAVYFKDVDSSEGELYMDGKKVDDDVYVYSINFNTADGSLYYMVDYDDGMGSLKYWNGKKATAVKDDVYTFYFTPEGECLFLYDYDTDSYRGELWIQDGKKVQKLDENVSAIIPVY